MYEVKIVSWTVEKVMECDSYEINKVEGGSFLQLVKEENVIFEHIMEEWMGEENVKVYITKDGKHYDSRSFYSSSHQKSQAVQRGTLSS